MTIAGLNHAVLYIRDLDVSCEFYTSVLEFTVIRRMGSRAAFLQASGSTNDHDLGLFAIGPRAHASTAGRSGVGLYHLAWEVGTLSDLARLRDRLSAAGALVGESDHGLTKSLYAQDPDGIEFEVVWLVPAALITEAERASADRISPLDLDAMIGRYGADTPGGVGVSRP